MPSIVNPSNKITFLLYSLERGGAERVASIITNQLIKKQNINLILINGPINYPLSQNIKIKKLRKVYTQRWMRTLTFPLVLFKLWKYLKKEEITTLYSFDTLPNLINCSLKYFKKNHISYLRVSNHTSTQFTSSKWRDTIFLNLIRLLYPKANRIIVNTYRIKEDLIKEFKLKNTIKLIQNPINISYIKKCKEGNFSSPKNFIFINVAGFRIQKNHNLLVEAFAKIRHLNAQLWLVGIGKEMANIIEKVTNLNLTSQIHFLDYQANPFKYMAAANCMVLSSDYEGLPNVLIEGLACGLPIISTDCPSGPREIIAPKTNYKNTLKEGIEIVEYGILTPVGNADCLAHAMEKVYYDKSFQNPEKYMNRAKAYDVKTILKQYEAFFL